VECVTTWALLALFRRLLSRALDIERLPWPALLWKPPVVVVGSCLALIAGWQVYWAIGLLAEFVAFVILAEILFDVDPFQNAVLGLAVVLGGWVVRIVVFYFFVLPGFF
jgi:hypothetical protein